MFYGGVGAHDEVEPGLGVAHGRQRFLGQLRGLQLREGGPDGGEVSPKPLLPLGVGSEGFRAGRRELDLREVASLLVLEAVGVDPFGSLHRAQRGGFFLHTAQILGRVSWGLRCWLFGGSVHLKRERLVEVVMELFLVFFCFLVCFRPFFSFLVAFPILSLVTFPIVFVVLFARSFRHSFGN